MAIEQAVILSGGRGTRLMPLTDSLPKPMIAVRLGLPFLFVLLRQLQDQGIKRVLLLTGYKGEVIEHSLQKLNEHHLTLNVKCVRTPDEWETWERMRHSRDLFEEDSLVLYGDNFSVFNLPKHERSYREAGAKLFFLAAKKEKGNLSLDQTGRVISYDPKRKTSGLDYVEIGYALMSRSIFEFDHPKAKSFSDVFPALIESQFVKARWAQHHYWSVSDMKRLFETSRFLQNKKILLIDRDGVINQKMPKAEYVTRWDEFQWIEENVLGMEQLAKRGYRFIVVSNQAGVQRGAISVEALDDIHTRMCLALKSRGIEILDIYVCPHHWDENCSCRKPKPEMLVKAAREHRFRIDQSLYIGDDPRDCEAAYAADTKAVFIGDKTQCDRLEQAKRPVATFSSLSSAVPWILDYLKPMQEAKQK